MKSISVRARRRSVFLIELWVMILLAPASQGLVLAGERSGVIVREVREDGLGLAAGLKPGDVLLAWKRLPNPPSNPEKEKGKIRTHFDWLWLSREQAFRGPVELRFSREGKRMKTVLPRGEWGIIVIPNLLDTELQMYNTGRELFSKGSFDQAVTHFNGMIREYTSKKQWYLASFIAFMVGHQSMKVQNFEQARQAYLEAISFARKRQDAIAMSEIYDILAKAFLRENNLESAIGAFESARDIRKKLWGACIAYADSANYIGQILLVQEKYDQVEQLYRENLEIMTKRAPGTMKEAWSYGNLGVISMKTRKLDEALGYYQKALEIFTTIDPESAEVAFTLNNLGAVAWHRGDIDTAADYFVQALAIKRKISPGSKDVASTLNNLGSLFWKRGDLSMAEKYYRESYDLYAKIMPESDLVAKLLMNRGVIACERGDLIAAEDYYKKSLNIFHAFAPNGIEEAGVSLNVANLAQTREDFDLSENYMRKALDIYRTALPNSLEYARALCNYGSLLMMQKRYEHAEDNYQQALALVERIARDSIEHGYILHGFGRFEYNRGRSDRAAELTEQAYQIMMKQAPESLAQADVLITLGQIALSRKALDKAEQYVAEASSLRRKLAPDSWLEAEAYHYLGCISRKKEDFTAALTYFELAVTALERQRRVWGREEELEKFSEQFAQYYRDLVEMQCRLGQNETAFHTLERFRARSLLSMITERDLDFSVDVPHDLVLRQKELNAQYDLVQEQLGQISAQREPEKTEALLKELQSLKSEQDDLKEAMHGASRRFSALNYPEPLNLRETQTIIGPDTLFVSYCTGDEAIQLFALYGNSMEVYSISCPRHELHEAVLSFRNMLARPHEKSDLVLKKGRSLFRQLLGPVQDRIPDARNIVVCADGPLHYLPFSALVTEDDAWLAEIKPISYIISATVYAEAKKAERSEEHALAMMLFGDPHYPENRQESGDHTVRSVGNKLSLSALPATRDEVHDISEFYYPDIRVFLGREASEEEAKKLDSSVQGIHFACHGYLDQLFPLNSGLILSIPEHDDQMHENGVLQAWEIFESLRIDADLVTLSACQTGLGKDRGGEGLIGLTRAFLYAGAKSVVSTLWSVADQSTTEFMKIFYQYRSQGLSNAQALHMAQKSFITNPVPARSENKASPSPSENSADYSHPFYWAGFILNGDYE